MNKKKKAEISVFYDLYKKEKGERGCNNCTNKNVILQAFQNQKGKIAMNTTKTMIGV